MSDFLGRKVCQVWLSLDFLGRLFCQSLTFESQVSKNLEFKQTQDVALIHLPLGIYDNLQKFNLPYPEAIFELDYFLQNPRPFNTWAKEFFPGVNYFPNKGERQVQSIDCNSLVIERRRAFIVCHWMCRLSITSGLVQNLILSYRISSIEGSFDYIIDSCCNFFVGLTHSILTAKQVFSFFQIFGYIFQFLRPKLDGYVKNITSFCTYRTINATLKY